MPISKATGKSVAVAAKGDLVVGSATNDAAVLAVGSANQVLTVDSSTTTGLKWAAAGSSFVGCAAYNSNFSLTFTSGVASTIAFPNEDFDTDAFHDNSTNNSRLTIPSGKGGKYLIVANIDLNAVSNYYICAINQFSSSGSGYAMYGLNRQFAQNAGGNNFASGTQAIIVNAVAGDYFTLTWQLGQASATITSQYARFSAYYLGA